jgi:hypothetical protein
VVETVTPPEEASTLMALSLLPTFLDLKVKVALRPPAGIVTLDGTLPNLELLLRREMVIAFGAGPVRATTPWAL